MNCGSTSERRAEFLETAAAAPRLLVEMKADVSGPGTELVREFIAPESRGIGFNLAKSRFRYNGDEHNDLELKVDLLEQHGFVEVVKPGHVPVYRMTDEFVRLLKGWSPTN